MDDQLSGGFVFSWLPSIVLAKHLEPRTPFGTLQDSKGKGKNRQGVICKRVAVKTRILSLDWPW